MVKSFKFTEIGKQLQVASLGGQIREYRNKQEKHLQKMTTEKDAKLTDYVYQPQRRTSLGRLRTRQNNQDVTGYYQGKEKLEENEIGLIQLSNICSSAGISY